MNTEMNSEKSPKIVWDGDKVDEFKISLSSENDYFKRLTTEKYPLNRLMMM